MSADRQTSSDIELRASVDSRKRIRMSSGLPLLDPERELHRAHIVQENRMFELLMKSPLRYRVEQKLLMRVRRQIKNPTWKPTGNLSGGGLAFHSLLIQQMQRLSDRFEGA